MRFIFILMSVALLNFSSPSALACGQTKTMRLYNLVSRGLVAQLEEGVEDNTYSAAYLRDWRDADNRTLVHFATTPEMVQALLDYDVPVDRVSVNPTPSPIGLMLGEGYFAAALPVMMRENRGEGRSGDGDRRAATSVFRGINLDSVVERLRHWAENGAADRQRYHIEHHYLPQATRNRNLASIDGFLAALQVRQTWPEHDQPTLEASFREWITSRRITSPSSRSPLPVMNRSQTGVRVAPNRHVRHGTSLAAPEPTLSPSHLNLIVPLPPVTTQANTARQLDTQVAPPGYVGVP